MKGFLKVLAVIAVCLVVLLCIAVVARNLIIKTSLSSGIKAMTGMELSIGSLDVGLFSPTVSVKGLKMFNPPDFSEKLMVDLPELYVRYDLPAIMKGKVHLPEIKLDLKELIVVKTAKGAMNIDRLKSLQPAKQEGAKPPEIKIDTLDLAIGKVVYKEFGADGPPRVTEFNINIHERHENISDPNVLIGLIVVKALRNTAISGLTGSLESADKILGSAASSLAGTGKKVITGVADTTVNTVDKAVGAVGSTLQGAVGGLFGGSSGGKEE
jgi:uncharacterized protein involved in outer membrane biogenesis